MAAFYNNLFRTADPRTILQATVNNIQIGVKESDTMLALHQIYKMLARKMKLKLPYILEGFFNSKMLGDVDQSKDIFMNKYLKDDSKQTVKLNQGKPIQEKKQFHIIIFRCNSISSTNPKYE